MPNLNKHRKAITEAGYTLNKDGTQVTNKSGKTVAGTNDSGFFSGSSTLTNIFKGDKKGEDKKTESKSASKSSPSKSKRPRSTSSPRISAKPKGRKTSMTKEQARKYTSASPSGTPTLMSQGGDNAETKETPKPDMQKKMDSKYGSEGKDLQPYNVEDRGKRDMYQGEAPAKASKLSTTFVPREEWNGLTDSQKRRAGLPTTINGYRKWVKNLTSGKTLILPEDY